MNQEQEPEHGRNPECLPTPRVLTATPAAANIGRRLPIVGFLALLAVGLAIGGYLVVVREGPPVAGEAVAQQQRQPTSQSVREVMQAMDRAETLEELWLLCPELKVLGRSAIPAVQAQMAAEK